MPDWLVGMHYRVFINHDSCVRGMTTKLVHQYVCDSDRFRLDPMGSAFLQLLKK